MSLVQLAFAILADAALYVIIYHADAALYAIAVHVNAILDVLQLDAIHLVVLQ